MDETNGLLRDILDALKTRPVEAIERGVNPVKSFNAGFNKAKMPVAVPSKAELCRQWLHEHPEDMALTVRELSALRQPLGIKISYVTWSQAKKEMNLNHNGHSDSGAGGALGEE
jgi:hypothetical protein